MKRTVHGLIISMILFWFSSVGFAAGVPGATDKVSAATLLVPFFEVGIDSSKNPHDTLLVLWTVNSSAIIHYHVWDVNGNAVALYGNQGITNLQSWNASMRGLISSASSAVKTALTDSTGKYYRGFVTIDSVAAETTLSPLESGYPFFNLNSLEGWTYYVRLAEGSSNSMAMVPIEEVGKSINNYMWGFYSSSDGREEIDVNARACAAALVRGGSCSDQAAITSIRSRVFLNNTSFNASSRIILFYWSPGTTQGVSPWCEGAGGCDATYTYNRYNESGSLVQQDTSFRLDNVVNVIDVSGTENGFVSILGIPGEDANWQAYAFSFTNAQPGEGASANWDAILESYINP